MIYRNGRTPEGSGGVEFNEEDRSHLNRLRSRKHRYTVWAENNGRNRIGTRYSFGNGNESGGVGLSFDRDAYITTASYCSINSGKKPTGAGVLEIVIIDRDGNEYIAGTITRASGERRGTELWSPAILIPAESMLSVVSATDNSSAVASIVTLTIEEDD